MKHKERDVIYILNNLNTFSTGIYSLVNKRVNYFNYLKSFVNTRQGTLEGDDDYIKQEKLEIETLILAGGSHVFCSPEIMEASDKAKSTEKETTGEEEKISAIRLP